MSKKQAYVISDLHIGGGEQSGGLDSFVQDEAFARFVKGISAPETTLLINGDFVDFVQIPPFGHPEKAFHLLWTEGASREKLMYALAAHPQCFGALREFIGTGGTLSICVGNHDLDWAWPGVQSDFRHEMGNPPSGRLRFAVDHAEVYEGVHIEHGHSFTPENCPADVWKFIHDGPDGVRYLERVWGTDFMLHWWNSAKLNHPYADCVKPEYRLLISGPMSWKEKAREMWRLVVFLRRRGLPRGAVASGVRADSPGTALRDTNPFDQFLAAVDQEDASVLQKLADSAPEFREAIREAYGELSAEEREVLISPAGKVNLPNVETGTDDVKPFGLLRPSREKRKAEEILRHPGITHVVFGHTHDHVDGNTPGAGLPGCWFNSGTWQPRLDLDRPDVRAKLKAQGITYEILKDKGLYDISLRTIRIQPNPPYRAAVELDRIL